MNITRFQMHSSNIVAGLFAACAAILMTTTPTEAATIGPDVFGYTATDDVPYIFTDIAGTGTRVLARADDITHGNAPIGFDFDFYGTDYTTVSFSPNGLLTFSGATSTYTNQDLAVSNPPGNLPAIAALWDDWQFFQTGADAVYFQTVGTPGNQQFVVQWNLAYGYSSSPSAVTFQAILFEQSNDIQLQFADVDTGDSRSFGGSATVGIGNKDGNLTGEHLVWSHNSRSMSNGQAVRFSNIPEPTAVGLLGLALGVVASGARPKRRTWPRNDIGRS